MADVKATDNGPFLLTGDVDYLDGKGKKLLTTNSGYLCRCGNLG